MSIEKLREELIDCLEVWVAQDDSGYVYTYGGMPNKCSDGYWRSDDGTVGNLGRHEIMPEINVNTVKVSDFLQLGRNTTDNIVPTYEDFKQFATSYKLDVAALDYVITRYEEHLAQAQEELKYKEHIYILRNAGYTVTKDSI